MTTAPSSGSGELLDKNFIVDVDSWIEQLYDCKQLTENQVKVLCEKAGL